MINVQAGVQTTTDETTISQVLADLTASLIAKFDPDTTIIRAVSHDVAIGTTTAMRRSLIHPGKISTTVPAYLITVTVTGADVVD